MVQSVTHSSVNLKDIDWGTQWYSFFFFLFCPLFFFLIFFCAKQIAPFVRKIAFEGTLLSRHCTDPSAAAKKFVEKILEKISASLSLVLLS